MAKNKDKKKTKTVVISTGEKKESDSTLFLDGSRSVKQLLSASGIDFTSPNEMLVDDNYARSFTLNYPSSAFVGFADKLYSYRGDMDIAIHIEPTDEKIAIEELTKKIAQYETQMLMDGEKNSVRNNTSVPAKLKNLYEQRSRLEQNNENMFKVTTAFTMYNKDLKKLNKDAQKFQAKLIGSRFHIMPLTLRQDAGYKTTSPLGINEIPDYYRNMNTGALSCLFPFYNPEINDIDGIFLGINRENQSAAFPNLYSKSLSNRNMFISGKSGVGKTVFTSTLALRSTARGIRTVIIDPENEYGMCVESVQGATIKIAAGSDSMINPFDIDEENRLDKNGKLTDEKYVDVKGKVSDVLSLLCIMVPACADSGIKADISDILMNLYAEFGITSEPESLYEEYSEFNEETGEYYKGIRYKTMPRLSDFCVKLDEFAKKDGNETLKKISRAFSIYREGGLYDLFDCYTTVDFKIFENVPMVRFDISEIESDVLRPLGLYITTRWIWDKFIKKHPEIQKLLISDEAWMMLHKEMKGSEYTALFLENCARRIRKYNGSLCCASQNFREFVERSEGLAVLSNSAVKIFLGQEREDIEAVGDKFILSQGERDFLLTATMGEALMKLGKESIILDTFVFPSEWKYIKKNPKDWPAYARKYYGLDKEE